MNRPDTGQTTDKQLSSTAEIDLSATGAMREAESELEHDLRTYLATRGDLSGRIGLFTPVELIQFLQFSRKRGMLRLFSSATRQAQCVVTEAGIASVVSDHLRDAEAALSFLSWKTGWFVFEKLDHLVSVDMCVNVNSVLMEAARLDDELGKRTEAFPGRRARLVTTATEGPHEDPLGCGAPMIFERIADRPGTTCAELERSTDLAPLKVRLAVACLAELQLVAAATDDPSSRPDAETDPQGWWQQALQRFPDGLKVLLGLAPTECPEKVLTALRRLARDLDTTAPDTLYSAKGPTFVRLRDPRGGLLSLTLLPIEKRQRFLFESLSRSAHVTITCGGDGDEVELWQDLAPTSTELRCMSGTCREGDCDLYTHIRRITSGEGCPNQH